MERKRTRALDRLDNVARIRRLQVGGGGGGGGGAHVGYAHVLSLGCAVCASWGSLLSPSWSWGAWWENDVTVYFLRCFVLVTLSYVSSLTLSPSHSLTLSPFHSLILPLSHCRI